jgi:hypothetical protein
LLISPLTQQASAFWRELFKVIKTPVIGQGKNSYEANSLTLDQQLRNDNRNRSNPVKPPRAERLIAQRKKSKSNQQKMPEPLGLAGDLLPGHAMACSL